MMYTKEQVLNGTVQYAEAEILSKLPTAGKVIAGAMIGMALKNSDRVLQSITSNQMLRVVGAITEEGLIDVDSVTECLRDSAGKYGSVLVSIPCIGDITLNQSDVDLLRKYIR